MIKEGTEILKGGRAALSQVCVRVCSVASGSGYSAAIFSVACAPSFSDMIWCLMTSTWIERKVQLKSICESLRMCISARFCTPLQICTSIQPITSIQPRTSIQSSTSIQCTSVHDCVLGQHSIVLICVHINSNGDDNTFRRTVSTSSLRRTLLSSQNHLNWSLQREPITFMHPLNDRSTPSVDVWILFKETRTKKKKRGKGNPVKDTVCWG